MLGFMFLKTRRRSAAMKIRSQFLKVILGALLFMCFGGVSGAQQISEQELPTLSPALHAALYPEVMCVHCIVPIWDHGYLLHVEIDRDPAVVTMYDKNGKKVIEARMEPADAAKVSIGSAGATRTGGIVAIGGGIMNDGSGQRFIVKSEPNGRITQSVRIGAFYPHQVCEATDRTIWVLGYESNDHVAAEADKNVLRHYSFEKGLLGSFVSLNSISQARDASLQIAHPRKSFLRCGKDRVSVLFWTAGQYIEVDAVTEKLTRWRVAPPSGVRGRASGFAVTEEGRSFVGLSDHSEQDKKITRGLYELKASAGSSVATLVSVAGTITKHDPDEIAAEGTFLGLWGADGNDLVVQRQGDGWGLSWAKVSTSVTTADYSAQH
jgi:hypothetical protein